MDSPQIQLHLTEHLAVCIVLTPAEPHPDLTVEVLDLTTIPTMGDGITGMIKYLVERTYRDATSGPVVAPEPEEHKQEQIQQVAALLPKNDPPTAQDLVAYRRGLAMAEAAQLDLAPFEITGNETRSDLLRLSHLLKAKLDSVDGRR